MRGFNNISMFSVKFLKTLLGPRNHAEKHQSPTITLSVSAIALDISGKKILILLVRRGNLQNTVIDQCYRAIPVGLPVPVEILTTISPNTTAIPIALTVFTESESTAADVTTEWTETEADTMEPSTQLSAVTLPTTVAATIEETTTMMSLSTRIVTTQIATTDLSLAIPDKSSVTIALQPIVSTIFPQKENLTMIESGIKGGW